MKRNALLGTLALVSLVSVSACGGRTDEASAPPAEAETAAVEAAVEAPAEAVEAAAGAAFADLTGDAAAGEKVFALCRSCHVLEEGVNRVGPSLHNIVGRVSGSVEGFNYTEANANSGITWTPEELFTYLEDPQGVIPGTRMAFPGVKDPQDRADLIAYLQTNGE